eukprot:353935-Chlamydomonas_euryale.AAC.3
MWACSADSLGVDLQSGQIERRARRSLQSFAAWTLRSLMRVCGRKRVFLFSSFHRPVGGHKSAPAWGRIDTFERWTVCVLED